MCQIEIDSVTSLQSSLVDTVETVDYNIQYSRYSRNTGDTVDYNRHREYSEMPVHTVYGLRFTGANGSAVRVIVRSVNAFFSVTEPRKATTIDKGPPGHA